MKNEHNNTLPTRIWKPSCAEYFSIDTNDTAQRVLIAMVLKVIYKSLLHIASVDGKSTWVHLVVLKIF